MRAFACHAGAPCGADRSNADVALIQCCMGQTQSDAGRGIDCDALAPYGSGGVSGD
jgi:hypothetical protein